MSEQLTKKYENKIIELLKPLFKHETTKEDISFYKNLIGVELVKLKTDIVHLVFKQIKETT